MCFGPRGRDERPGGRTWAYGPRPSPRPLVPSARPKTHSFVPAPSHSFTFPAAAETSSSPSVRQTRVGGGEFDSPNVLHTNPLLSDILLPLVPKFTHRVLLGRWRRAIRPLDMQMSVCRLSVCRLSVSSF